MTELKQYYRNIEKKLTPGSHKKRFLHELRTSVDAWLEENPNADFHAVQQRFGTPERIAAEYAGEADTQEIAKKYKLRKWTVSIVAGAAVLALLMWLIAIVLAYINAADDAGGYIETSPIIEEILEENT